MFLFLELYISFVESSYSVREDGGRVIVCAELSGALQPVESPVWVGFQTEDRSAEGENTYITVAFSLSMPIMYSLLELLDSCHQNCCIISRLCKVATNRDQG